MRIDGIIENGRIHQYGHGVTTDRLAFHQGRILAVGDDVDHFTARQRIDAQGCTVLSGFNDAHTHSIWFGLTLMEIDLSAVTGLNDLYRIIESAAPSYGSEDWIVAAGYNHLLHGRRQPDRRILDRISGGRPVWIKYASGHVCCLNSAALAQTDVADYGEYDIVGGRIVMDESGHPTGELQERAMSLVQSVRLPYSLETIEHALGLASARYLAEGVTSVSDAGVGGGLVGHSPRELLGYQRARASGALRTRVQGLVALDVLQALDGASEEAAAMGLPGGMASGFGDDWFSFGPTKAWIDGSIMSHTAQVTEHYAGCPGEHGLSQDDPAVLRERVLGAYAGGWVLALHAVGDAALDTALDLIEEARNRFGAPALPNRIEHGLVVRPDQRERLVDLNVACVVQPQFISTFGEGIRDALGEDRVSWSAPARSTLDSGMPLAGSSDRPVAPGAPLSGIQTFVERMTEAGSPFGHAERITAAEATLAFTSGSATVTGLEKHKGTLEPGKLADMVILESHPSEVETSQIAQIPVLATLVGGDLYYRHETF